MDERRLLLRSSTSRVSGIDLVGLRRDGELVVELAAGIATAVVHRHVGALLAVDGRRCRRIPVRLAEVRDRVVVLGPVLDEVDVALTAGLGPSAAAVLVADET